MQSFNEFCCCCAGLSVGLSLHKVGNLVVTFVSFTLHLLHSTLLCICALFHFALPHFILLTLRFTHFHFHFHWHFPFPFRLRLRKFSSQGILHLCPFARLIFSQTNKKLKTIQPYQRPGQLVGEIGGVGRSSRGRNHLAN